MNKTNWSKSIQELQNVYDTHEEIVPQSPSQVETFLLHGVALPPW